MARTFISPFVRVPVLSEQMTEAAPSVATAVPFPAPPAAGVPKNAVFFPPPKDLPGGKAPGLLARGGRRAGRGALVPRGAGGRRGAPPRGAAAPRRKDDHLSGHELPRG